MRAQAQFQIGMRWLGCGWRLYRRAPLQLAAFGLTAGLAVVLASWVPIIGALLVGALAPLFLGSACLVLDETARQGKTSRGPRRSAALKAGARSLLRVFDKEARLIPLMLFSIYSLTVVLLAKILLWITVYRVVASTGLLGGVLGALLALGVIVMLLGSLVYALPLAFLRDEPVGTAVVLSSRVAIRHIYAVLVPFGLLALPAALGALGAIYSLWAAYAVGILAGALAFPWAAAALYCSFRTLFATEEAAVTAASPRRAAARTAAR